VIEAYLNQRIEKIEAPNGYDAYGKPVYVVTATNVPCRWQGKVKLVRDNTGKEVVAQAEVWTKAVIGVDHRIAYGGRTYTVIVVTEVVGLGGELDHRKVYV